MKPYGQRLGANDYDFGPTVLKVRAREDGKRALREYMSAGWPASVLRQTLDPRLPSELVRAALEDAR